MVLDIKALVLDLGGVLLEWDRHSVTSLSSGQFLTIMNSIAWHDLDRGKLTVKEACKEFGATLEIEPSIIEHALDEAQLSLTVNAPLTQTIRDLKELIPDLELYIMSNISREHYKKARMLSLPWDIFKSIFISGEVGERKPDLCFFQHVVQQTGVDPSQIVMIDDTVENICAARSVGMHGLLADDEATKSGCALLNLLLDPLPRAEAYLKSNAKKHHCVVEGAEDLALKDNYAQMLLWELTGDENLVYFKWPSEELHGTPAGDSTNGCVNGQNGGSIKSDLNYGLWNYFYEEPVLTTRYFPPDADTTSIAYLSLPPKYLSMVADVELVLDAMATNLNSDGIMQTYFASDRPRASPEVCCNMLCLFYRFGRGADPRIRKTEEWVISCLKNNACLNGSRHYSTPETLLYFASRLRVECGPGRLANELDVVKGQLGERLGVPVNPLSLAFRISACQLVGIDEKLYRKDVATLLSLQDRDGGWPAGHFCCIGKTGARIGNRGLTTALAAKIIRGERGIM
ncbi:HAD-like protein [Annulohypoxylon maeteangense]|uniref:HAD-like protein n=1 Tax=Annulohypoxylon maeteangense TaxID=1927788 RepID=UPI002008B1C6|nr:HAD-like protein [Annulohypoxylon maeteangense]KAI0882903.1 HAD-like protein [Annulohypoxylon maeteangense]